MKVIFAILFIFLSVPSISAQTFDFLDINNVKARINSNGDLFLDDSLNNSFEVPKGSGLQSIFAGGLWIGGYDVNGNLHLSAQTYHQARNDFSPGPLPTDSLNSLLYNRVWKISRSDIDTFVFEFTHGFPNVNYVVPEGIQSWPGNGSSFLLQDHLLSPYVDFNSDGNYNYLDGDYPCIKGDQAVYFIINDISFSQPQHFPLEVEIHGMAYAFQSVDPALNNSIFLNYNITCKHLATRFDSTWIGNWTDFDLGYNDDDYNGCDVERNMYYVYNGDGFDEGPSGYGLNPPAEGVVFLKGPDADVSDSVDNDRDSCIDCTLFQTPTGDSIVGDDVSPEKIGMSRFMYYSNDNNPVGGNPSSDQDYFGYLRSIWRNGNLMTYGGDGKGSGSGATMDRSYFMYPGSSDPNDWGTNGIPENDWDEVTAGNLPGDRRGIASMGPFTFNPGEVVCIDYAYVFAKADTGGAMASLDSLRSSVDRVRNFYTSHAELQSCTCTTPSLISVEDNDEIPSDVLLYPNPAFDNSTLQYQLLKKSKVEIEIVDQTGRIIKSWLENSNIGLNLVKFDLKDFASGVYFVNLKMEKYSEVKMLMVLDEVQ